jgi:hypothetical protein
MAAITAIDVKLVFKKNIMWFLAVFYFSKNERLCPNNREEHFRGMTILCDETSDS